MPETATDLEDIKRRCLDSQGYVLGVGIITDARDKEGNNLIDFQYRRFHVSLEDTKQVIAMFEAQLAKEVQERFEQNGT